MKKRSRGDVVVGDVGDVVVEDAIGLAGDVEEDVAGDEHNSLNVLLLTCSCYGDHFVSAHYIALNKLKKDLGIDFDVSVLFRTTSEEREKLGCSVVNYNDNTDTWEDIGGWKTLHDLDKNLIEFQKNHHCITIPCYYDD